MIIIGTSLKVHPFARLPDLAPPTCPRLLLNLEPAGAIGQRPNDVVHLGPCDSAVRELCDILGWRDELEVIWKRAGGGSKVKKDSKTVKDADSTANVRNTKDAGGSSEVTAKNLQQKEKKSGDKTPEENNVEKTLEHIISDMQQTLIITPKSDEVGGTPKQRPLDVHDDQEPKVKADGGGVDDKDGAHETTKNVSETSGSKSAAQVSDLVQEEDVSASTLNQLAS